MSERVKTVSGRLMSFIYFVKLKNGKSQYKPICCTKITHAMREKSTSSSCEELEVHSFSRA